MTAQMRLSVITNEVKQTEKDDIELITYDKQKIKKQ